MDLQNLFNQFAPMMGMLKGGRDPMSMIQSMMGSSSNTPMARAMQAAAQASQGRDPGGLENFVRSEYQKAGLDIQEVRRTLGI